jgi:hypothetical protein
MVLVCSFDSVCGINAVMTCVSRAPHVAHNFIAVKLRCGTKLRIYIHIYLDVRLSSLHGARPRPDPERRHVAVLVLVGGALRDGMLFEPNSEIRSIQAQGFQVETVHE